MAHRILHLAKTTRGSCDARALRARRDHELASREFHADMEMWGSFLCWGPNRPKQPKQWQRQ